MSKCSTKEGEAFLERALLNSFEIFARDADVQRRSSRNVARVTGVSILLSLGTLDGSPLAALERVQQVPFLALTFHRFHRVATVPCLNCGRDVEPPRQERWIIAGDAQYATVLVAFVFPHCAREIKVDA
jgi:hypothetical protein